MDFFGVLLAKTMSGLLGGVLVWMYPLGRHISGLKKVGAAKRTAAGLTLLWLEVRGAHCSLRTLFPIVTFRSRDAQLILPNVSTAITQGKEGVIVLCVRYFQL